MTRPFTKRVPPLVWLLGLQLLLVLPFAGQPFHIDDGIYLDIARHAVHAPLHPQDFPYIFEGWRVPDLGSHTHPPFVSYWIALLLRLFGDGPRVHVMLHLGFIVFPLLFTFGMYRLAVRFTEIPVLTTLVAILSPAALVAAHTIMTDYPCLALSTLGLALYIDGADERRPVKIWIAGVVLTLAAFCAYPAVAIAGLCWVYAILKKCKMRAAKWAPLLAPAWMAVWLTYSSLYFHRFVLGATVQYTARTGGLSIISALYKLLAFPIFLAGVLVLLLPLIRLAWKWLRGGVAIIWVVASVALTQLVVSNYDLTDRLLVILFLTVGGWTLIGLALRIAKTLSAGSSSVRQDGALLAGWVAITIAQVLIAFSSMTARFLLPMLPPLVLLAFLKGSGATSYLRRSAMIGASAGLTLGLILSVADFTMAHTHRVIALQLGRTYHGWESQVRFGGEWGMRHYMLEQGFRQYESTGDDFSGGQFVVQPGQAVAYAVPQDVETMLVPVRRQVWQTAIPIQMMNRTANAGFYSSTWGLLPFSFSRAPIEEITVRQVSYLVEKLPEIRLENAPKDAVVIPRPVDGGGVELVAPMPSRIVIPYNIPQPTRVRFFCTTAARINQCPVRISYERDGAASDVVLQHVANSGKDETLSFDLPGLSSGVVILNVTASEAPLPTDQVIIRNWAMLPAGVGR
jgi:hypothetical protein